MPKYLLTYLFTYLKKLWSLILFIKRNGRLGQQKHSLEIEPLKSRWPYIKPLCFSPSHIIKRQKESGAICQQAVEQPRILLLKCSLLTKLTEIDAVSIKMAHLVLTHQISQAKADLHHCNRLSTEGWVSSSKSHLIARVNNTKESFCKLCPSKYLICLIYSFRL